MHILSLCACVRSVEVLLNMNKRQTLSTMSPALFLYSSTANLVLSNVLLRRKSHSGSDFKGSADIRAVSSRSGDVESRCKMYSDVRIQTILTHCSCYCFFVQLSQGTVCSVRRGALLCRGLLLALVFQASVAYLFN